MLSKGEDGRIGYKTIVEKVWRCSTQQNDDGSVSVRSSILGGNVGGRKFVQSSSLTHGQEVRPQPSSGSADAVKKSSMEGV